MDLASFLKEIASEQGQEEGDFLSNSTFKIGETLPKKTSGVVYGFVVRLNAQEKLDLFNEAKKLGGNKFDADSKTKSIINDYYPLYWGKNSDIFGRINAHVTGHKGGNSNLGLKDYSTIEDKEILYARIYLNNNEKIEKYLISTYPPLLKTRKQ